MKNFLIPETLIWTKKQKLVFDSDPNIIVTGCPGSGKTLLAINLAIKYSAQNCNVAVIVFTKALRTFINDLIIKNCSTKIKVFYEREWDKQDFKTHDIIIIDEFQDFSINDIKSIIPFASRGVYLFGDTEQQLYDRNLKKERTLEFEELVKLTNFKTIFLDSNFRIPNKIVNLLKSIYTKDVSSSNADEIFHSSYKRKGILASVKQCISPEVIKLPSYEDQLNWIVNFLSEPHQFKNIGILLKQNKQSKNGYFMGKKVYIEYLPGILETAEILLNNGISLGYKFESDDRLIFSEDVNVNLLTIHSSKGLEFDCVILPFYSYTNRNFNLNIPYVAFSRCNQKLVILYSGIISEDLQLSSNQFVTGEIRKHNYSDQVNSAWYEYPERYKRELDELDSTIKTLDNFWG